MLLPLKTPKREDEREGGIYLRQSLPYDPFEGRRVYSLSCNL